MCKLQREIQGDKSADGGEVGLWRAPLTFTFVFVSITSRVIGMHRAAAAILSYTLPNTHPPRLTHHRELVAAGLKA